MSNQGKQHSGVSLITDWISLFAEQGANLAVRCGNNSLTQAELALQAARIAQFLPDSDQPSTQTNPVVAIFGGRALTTIEGIIGSLLAGQAYSVLDTVATRQRLSALLDILRPTALILAEQPDIPTKTLITSYASSHSIPMLEWYKQRLNPIPHVLDMSSFEPSGGEDIAYVMFTSGTTGEPKGVCVSHAAARMAVDSYVENLKINANDVIANEVAFTFDVSMLDMFAALSTGAILEILEQSTVDCPERLAQELVSTQSTILFTVPTVTQELLQVPRFNFGNLRTLALTGEVLSTQHAHALLQAVPQNANVWNFYGGTEMPYVFARRCMLSATDEPSCFAPSAPGLTLGLDGDFQQNHWSPGQVGELSVRGVTVMSGYLVKDGIWPVDRPSGALMHHTGDLFEVQTNHDLCFVGRADRQVRVHGYRVELDGLEACAERLPWVKHTIAILQGNGKLLLAATVDQPPSDSILKISEACCESFPEFSTFGEVRIIDKLPRTASGKKDRQGASLLFSKLRKNTCNNNYNKPLIAY